MGRMKTDSARAMKKMAMDAKRRSYFAEQRKTTNAIVDLAELRAHVRKLLEINEICAQSNYEHWVEWRDKASELLLKE